MMDARFFRLKILTAIGAMCFAVSPVLAATDFYGGIVESNYYQLSPQEQTYDQKVMAEKEALSDSSARILASIAEIDEAIYKIDADLAKYRSTEARQTLLVERQRLFAKRREYKELSAAYNQKQMRMTQDLSYNSQAVRGTSGDAYADGDFAFTMGTGTGAIDDPQWGKLNSNKESKSVFVVKSEKDMREVAEVISKRIYGEFNADIYTQLLLYNHNSTVNPSNLLAGDNVMLPYQIAALTMMGIQQKALVDSTMEVIASFKDAELKRNMLKYAVFADETAKSREAFTKVLIAARIHGESSPEFKQALTDFMRSSEGSAVLGSRNLMVTGVSTTTGAVSGDSFVRSLGGDNDFMSKLQAVSNASANLGMLPEAAARQVRKAAEEYTKLKNYASSYGAKDHRTTQQFAVLKKAVEDAHTAVKPYISTGSTFVLGDNYSVENDPTGVRSSANASVFLRREITEMNRTILQLTKDVYELFGKNWNEEQGIWDSTFNNKKKEVSRTLFTRTDMDTESSSAAQLIQRMKMVYANAEKYAVDLYRDANYSVLRKRMIAMVGLSSVAAEIQPAFFSLKDNSFRQLKATAAIQRLGIDIENKDFDFYDRGAGAKPQFEVLVQRDAKKMTEATSMRNEWAKMLVRFAEMNANFKDQEELESLVKLARDFWQKDLGEKLDRQWKGTAWGGALGVGGGVLAVVAITNFWNPIGWVSALAITGGAAVAGVIVGQNIDHNADIEKLKQYAQIKVIADMAHLALKEGNLRMVEHMLYIDEIAKGYI